jgi:hypothetical protein
MKNVTIKLGEVMDEWKAVLKNGDKKYESFKLLHVEMLAEEKLGQIHSEIIIQNEKNKNEAKVKTNGARNEQEHNSKENTTANIIASNSLKNQDDGEHKLQMKYFLKPVHFDGKQHQGKHYCILIKRTKISKVSVFAYLKKISDMNKNAIISIIEEDEFYIVNYKFIKKPNFQTPHKFKPKQTEDALLNAIKIFTVEKNRKKFSSTFKVKESIVSPSITSEYLGEIIVGNSEDENNAILGTLLASNFTKLKIKYINEFNCSLMMAMLLFGFSKTQKNSYVYSFEKSMNVNNVIRKCDALYIHKTVLVIFEWKSNINKIEHPLEYIDKREYVEFVLKYFREYEPHIIKKITKIRRVGVEFFGKNKNYNTFVSTQPDLCMTDFAFEDLQENIFLKKKRIKKINYLK